MQDPFLIDIADSLVVEDLHNNIGRYVHFANHNNYIPKNNVPHAGSIVKKIAGTGRVSACRHIQHMPKFARKKDFEKWCCSRAINIDRKTHRSCGKCAMSIRCSYCARGSRQIH